MFQVAVFKAIYMAIQHRYCSSWWPHCLCSTFPTCYLWESEAAQMGSPAGGTEICALLNEKRLGSHSTRSVHSSVILACSMVQSWYVLPSCLPDNLWLWLWGALLQWLLRKSMKTALHQILYLSIKTLRFCTLKQNSHKIPSFPSPELSIHNLIFRLWKHNFASCNTALALF